MNWDDTVTESAGVLIDTVRPLVKPLVRYYGNRVVEPNGAVPFNITLNRDQYEGLCEVAREQGLKSLDAVIHLAVREFLRAEGVLWHEGRLRISIVDYYGRGVK